MTVEIPLTRGFVALVDEGDVAKVSLYKWRATTIHRSVYAQATITTDKGRESLFMHRLILLDGDKTRATVVDHINGNGLDNRRANLRGCSVADNTRNKKAPISTNSSGCTGVEWRKDKQVWRAAIVVDSKRRHLGSFREKQDAIDARLKAEKLYYGAFAPAANRKILEG